ncbi:hypothetical protein 2 [Shuangao toti-like virus]|uniref:RNA-directed RNA polymerase n=1 Tax=Shuangao toti-like virus TaxID=1923477 RepID=A0A1L3KF31_9VIRU|nr:hypothetical protein 2 [Shuangao toti-like virus]APG76011.1 hypothetical protein 2 [Shuangao toti-like virus]
MKEKIKEIKNDIGDKLKCCDIPGFNCKDYGMNEGLKRYRLGKMHGKCPGCELGDGIWEDNIHLLCHLVGKEVGSEICRWALNMKSKYHGACKHGVFQVCKAQTGLMKMGGESIHPHWRHLTYWELGYGYTSYVKWEEMKPNAYKWLGRDFSLGGPINEKEYIRMMCEEVITLMKEEWTMPKQCPNIDEWTKRGRWMRGHAGTGPSGFVTIEGKVVKTRKMKGVEGAAKSDRLISEMLFYPVRETFQVLQKSEGGKIRPVVKTGNKINRMMDYLSEVWEVGMYGSRVSTLFAGVKGNEEIDMELHNLAKDESWYKVPLDQGSFDWHQSKESVLAVLDTVWNYIKPFLTENSEIWKVWEVLRESLHKETSVHVGPYHFPWKNGLPSGWRWTALLDTFLNVCSFRVIKRISEGRIRTNIPIAGFHAQGDDVIFGVKIPLHAAVIMDTYKKIGYEVHPLKTYVSRKRGEFLRRSYDQYGVTGYTARTCLSIRFRNPILEMPLNRAERLYSRLTLWHLCVLRGCDTRRVVLSYLEDAKQARVKVRDAADFALTPNCLGGGGVDPNSSLGSVLREYGSGEWKIAEVTRYRKEVKPHYQEWNKRLEEAKVELEGSRKIEFEHLLAQSWGVRQAELYGKVYTNFVPIQRIKPIQPGGPGMVPIIGNAWNVNHIPVLVRNLFQRQKLDRNEEEDIIKPDWIGVVRELKERMSRAVFTKFMVDDIKIPSPIVDRIGMKYGNSIKDRARDWLRRALSGKNIGMKRLEQYLLWIETRLGQEIKLRYPDIRLGL